MYSAHFYGIVHMVEDIYSAFMEGVYNASTVWQRKCCFLMFSDTGPFSMSYIFLKIIFNRENTTAYSCDNINSKTKNE